MVFRIADNETLADGAPGFSFMRANVGLVTRADKTKAVRIFLRYSTRTRRWTGGQLSSRDPFTFGQLDATFGLSTNLLSAAPSAVAGVFLMENRAQATGRQPAEIDACEISRWGQPTPTAGSFNYWPPLPASGVNWPGKPFDVATYIGGWMRCLNRWSATAIQFDAYAVGPTKQIATPYTVMKSVSTAPMNIYLNFWMHKSMNFTPTRDVEYIMDIPVLLFTQAK